MKLATWLTILVLGPGSIAVFIWFLTSVRRIFARKPVVDHESAEPSRQD